MDPINQIKSRMRSNFGWCDISPPLPPLYLFLSQNSIWAVNDCIFLDNFVCVCVCVMWMSVRSHWNFCFYLKWNRGKSRWWEVIKAMDEGSQAWLHHLISTNKVIFLQRLVSYVIWASFYPKWPLQFCAAATKINETRMDCVRCSPFYAEIGIKRQSI